MKRLTFKIIERPLLFDVFLLRRLWPSSVLLLAALIGCSVCSSFATPPPPFPSGGLGLTKVEWERHHTLVELHGDDFYRYDALEQGEHYVFNSYDVQFWHEGAQANSDSIVSSITADLRRVLSDTLHMPPSGDDPGLDLKHEALHLLLPDDAQLQKTEKYPQDQDTFIEYYHSTSLENRYPALALAHDPWSDDAPGTIRVIYRRGRFIVIITAGAVGMPQPTITSAPTDSPAPTAPPMPPAVLTGIPRPVPSFPAPVPSKTAKP
jgi:hypothetical protein